MDQANQNFAEANADLMITELKEKLAVFTSEASKAKQLDILNEIAALSKELQKVLTTSSKMEANNVEAIKICAIDVINMQLKSFVKEESP